VQISDNACRDWGWNCNLMTAGGTPRATLSSRRRGDSSGATRHSSTMRTRASGGSSSRSAIGRLRTANQRLVGSVWTTPLDAVRFMLAMQGQDFPGVKWAIGLRVPGSTEADVDAAFAAGQIVRSWPMRGTLHVTAAEDLPWMLALLGERVVDGAASRRAALQLDRRDLDRARDLAIRHLEGGRALARTQLLAAMDAGGVSTDGQRGYHVLFYLAITGTICLGPVRGKEQAFVLLEEWITKPRRLEHDEALEELARRYFVSHGPATLADFSGWAKLTMKDVRAGVALAREHLVDLTVEGTTYLMAEDAEAVLARARPEVSAAVIALPGFDEYVLGYKERSAVLAPEHFGRVVPGGNGVFMPTIVVDGQVRGTWRRTARRKETAVESLPFSPKERLELAPAAAAWARFTGTTICAGASATPRRPARKKTPESRRGRSSSG
jgi:hypothetical protein